MYQWHNEQEKKKKKDLHSPEQPCEQSCKSKKKK